MGMLVLAVPAAIGSLILFGGLAWLVAIQTTEGQATGNWMHMTLSSACGTSHQAAMLSRLTDYGLQGQFTSDGSLSFQGPGLEDDRTHMPRALTRPGRFELWQNGAVKYTRFKEAGVQISLQGPATAILMLEETPDPDGLELRIDGQPVEMEMNGNEVQLHITEEGSQKALRQATDWVVSMRYPLPCEVQVLDVREGP
ncbi:MAG TPA: hypothetical protein PKW90_25135 [Myxococcota bacterium]|nr:hypothetical protein [Myxococcota bacterium]